jgi:hypothetical protein
MTKFFGVSEAVRELQSQYGEEVEPRVLTNLFYQRRLDSHRCPIIGGRRLIPHDYLPVILRTLRERGSNRGLTPQALT